MFVVSLSACFLTQDTELQLLKEIPWQSVKSLRLVKHSCKLAAKGNCNSKVILQKLNKIMSVQVKG